MSKQSTQSETTPKKEPHSADVSRGPQFGTVLAEMAWQVAIPFMALTLGGNWIDGKQSTEPLFTIIGLFVGIAAVILVVRKLILKHYPDTYKKEKK